MDEGNSGIGRSPHDTAGSAGSNPAERVENPMWAAPEPPPQNRWTPPPPFVRAPPIDPSARPGFASGYAATGDPPAGYAATSDAAPYPPQYPPAPDRSWASALGRPYVSSRGQSRIAVAFLCLAALAALAVAIHFITGLQLIARSDTGSVTAQELNSFDDLTRTISWAQAIIAIVSGVAFLRWIWRSVGNATTLGARPGIVDARGSVTAWLVPIRNLWKPYQVVMDLHDRLLDPLRSTTGRWLIRLWWVFWILGDVAGLTVLRFVQPTTFTDMARMWTVLIFADGLTIADAILAIAVILQIQRLSDARELARAGNPNAAIDLVSRSQRPMVTRAPFALALAALVVVAIPAGVVYPAAANVGSGSDAGAWQTFTAPDGSFSVDLPSRPIHVSAPQTTTGGVSMTSDRFTSRVSADASYTVTFDDYPSGMLASVTLAQGYENITRAVAGTATVTASRDITVAGIPAREVTAVRSTLRIRAWFVIRGDRVYVIEADTTAAMASSPDVDRFFASFALK